MLNNFDISDIERDFTEAVRATGVSEHIWNNRPKAVNDEISSFVVVRVSGGVADKEAFGDCRVLVHLYARDVLEKKNSKRLSVMQKKLTELSLTPGNLLVNPHCRVVGDTADDFGFHARILNFKVFIKA